MPDKILGFRGKYRWLSNFPYCPIDLRDGNIYPSPENAYQAFKTLDMEERKQFLNIKSSEAKKLGRVVTMRPNWEDIKFDIMSGILWLKFSKEPFKTKLLETEDAYIEETNNWGDTYWGVCNGIGENHLGKIIMSIRDVLQIMHKMKPSE